MISWISNWAEAIIIVVIIATIIEMILPEGSSKKYIKVVIGVYILFTIISPVITKFTGKSLAVSDIIDLNKYIDEVETTEASQNILQENNYANIRDIYIGNLKADIQNKLKSKGYVVTNIELDVGNDENYTLNKIILTVSKQDEKEEEQEETNTIQSINEVNISVTNTTQSNVAKDTKKGNLSNKDKNKIREYLSNVYEINERNIEVN